VIRALESNTLGLVLASTCGALLAVCLGLIVVWAMPPSAVSGEGDPADADISADIASLQSSRPLEEYGIVSERPVFNEDRRPAPVLGEENGEELPPEPDTGAPDVQLAGIVITPSLRMATLKSPDHQQSLVAFEGKPLEGDFGTWQVSRIEERMVTLASADGEELQLELQVHDAVIKEPPKPEGPASALEQEGGEELQTEEGESQVSEPMSRAEEIRQRIEERREELRRAAEDRDADQAENYRDAIQSMIQKSQDRGQEEQAQKDG